MMSIIIPAHNEATVIGRLLATLLERTSRTEFEIIVVCNGCTDDTADIARKFGSAVEVIEVSVASKVYALNVGDDSATCFPRFYVDADVMVTPNVLRALARRLEVGDVLVCSPVGQYEVSKSSWPVRQYFRVRACLPSAREGVGGSGVYALSEAGRRRFGTFPNVLADDSFVRLQFDPRERASLKSETSTVYAPRDLRSLLAVRSRIYHGLLELSSLFPTDRSHRSVENGVALAKLAAKPQLWAGIAIYLYVSLTARARARTRQRTPGKRGGLGDEIVWQRDQTTRNMTS